MSPPMRYGGFEAAPADFAASAPRLSEAADELRTAFAAADTDTDTDMDVDTDTEFEHRYQRDRRAAIELAGSCELALRDLARRLAATGAAYAAAEDAAAERFGELALRLDAMAATGAVSAEAVSMVGERR